MQLTGLRPFRNGCPSAANRCLRTTINGMGKAGKVSNHFRPIGFLYAGPGVQSPIRDRVQASKVRPNASAHSEQSLLG